MHSTLLAEVLYALRTLRRSPLVTVTVVGTLALGLALVTVVFAFYSFLFLRPDDVEAPDKLFAIERPVRHGADAWKAFTLAEYDSLRREAGVFADVFAVVRGIESRVEGSRATAALVTGNFFQTLGVRPVLGRTWPAAADGMSSNEPVIVLSHKGWARLMGKDPSAVGRIVHINGSRFEVIGVMPEGFRGLSVWAPDYWALIGLLEQMRSSDPAGRKTLTLDEVIARLKPDVSTASATTALRSWASRQHTSSRAAGFDLNAIRLRGSQGSLSDDLVGGTLRFAPLFVAFGLILLIGCANVANLLLATATSRRREMATRLSLGASKARVMRQLFTESLLLAAGAAVVAYGVARGLLDAGFRIFFATLPPEVAELVTGAPPDQDWRVLVFLAVAAVLSTCVFGLVPAIHVSRLDLARTVRGEISGKTNSGRARQALIAVQVCASSLLLICSFLLLRGALTAGSLDVGLRTHDTVLVTIASETSRARVVDELSAHPSVAKMAGSAPGVEGPFRSVVVAEAVASASQPLGSAAAGAASTSRRGPVSYQFVSNEYFDVLGIDMVRGRAFTPAERTHESGVVVVSQQTASRFWPGRNAIGESLRLDTDPQVSAAKVAAAKPSFRTYIVIGVTRDVEQRMTSAFSRPSLYLPAPLDSAGMSFVARVNGDLWDGRQALLADLNRIPIAVSIRTMRTATGLIGYVLGLAFWIAVFLGGLALALTVSALFSVLSFLIEQRAKEIGVRVALGATRRNVAWLVVSQAMRPVVIGLSAGTVLAAALTTAMLSMPVAVLLSGAIHVFDSVAYLGSAFVVVTACAAAALVPALRAARTDPMVSLRAP